MSGLKISVLANDGSPLGISSRTLWGDTWRVGLGGAEYALITMCEEWAKVGHEVILYNDPMEFAASPFEQRNIADFVAQDERDILIIFRSPNTRIHTAKGLKVWWSCDQYTVDDFSSFAPKVDRIVCISDYHVQYFKNVYGIQNAIHIDLPVRLSDFENAKVERIHNRLLFTSIPDRGLKNLFRIYPKIQRELPDVSLTITSDYRLWGAEAGNHQHRVDWMLAKNVNFLGAVPRGRLIEEQLTTDLLIYPCCLLPDASINMIDGSYVFAKDFDLGTNLAVIGGDGYISRVKQKFTRYFDGDAVDIRIVGEDMPLLATSDHKVLCAHREDVKKWKQKVVYSKKVGNPIPELPLNWRPLKELKKWDYIASPRKNVFPIDMSIISPKSYYDFEVNETTGKLYCHNVRENITERNDGGIPSTIPLNNNAGLLFGYFLAEGSASNNATVTFTFSKEELDWAENTLALGKEIFDLSGKIYDRDNYLIVNFSSKPLCTLFNKMFGRSKDRRIPLDFLCASQEFKLGLMKGYWRGDGSVAEYGVVLSSVSEILARQTKLIMETLGFPVSIRKNRRDALWTLFIGGKEADVWSQFIQKKKSFLKIKNRVGSYRVELENYWLIPIKSVRHFHYSGDVYDLGLSDNHHSFLSSNVIVHNCYEELFCIAVAEAQCCGAYPVTSDMGALVTTNMGTIIHGDANRPPLDDLYVEAVVELLSDRKKLEVRRAKNKVEAKLRFAPENILQQWNEKVFK